MITPPTPHPEHAPQAPLLRDPPPPPGYVEPLAGSSAEDTYGDADRSRYSRPRQGLKSTEHR
ncbi:hypothetical protein [Knoellia alttitudinis]|uniref:hypothetical protein n=1 Tax=Knoellia altitudinis TaxID=3404795 RepID=UPI00360715A7